MRPQLVWRTQYTKRITFRQMTKLSKIQFEFIVPYWVFCRTLVPIELLNTLLSTYPGFYPHQGFRIFEKADNPNERAVEFTGVLDSHTLLDIFYHYSNSLLIEVEITVLISNN